MKKEIANFDTTYCNNKECKNKCWRYFENYIFEKNKGYWFMDNCEKNGKEGNNEKGR